MHLMVIGAGGVGGYMVGRLGTVLANPECPLNELSVVARGAHLKAIQEHGLTYLDPYGKETTVRPAAAAADPAQLPRPDFVLLCVKGYDLEAAADTIAPHLDTGTPVLPLLNGADIDERVRERLSGRAVVFPGCIYISAFIEKPGRVRHAGGPGSILLGTSADAPNHYPEQFLTACRVADIPIEWREDPAPAIWEKFLFIAPFSLVTAVSGEPVGGVLENEALRADVHAIIAETAAIARRKGVRLEDDIVEAVMEKAAGFPAGTRTSFQRDIAAGSARDERDIFAGTILRLGKRHRVATPVAEKYTQGLPSPGTGA